MLRIYDVDQVAKIFKGFADIECKGKSTLYYQLAHQVAEDQFILQLCRECRERQPIPNLLFGAVHYLLLSQREEPLAAHYPSITGKESNEIPYDLFRAFCLQREEVIKEILKTRIVQTNAVNRTSYLMPIISSLHQEDELLAVVDIGTSSGLVLNYDQYRYVYENDSVYGHGKVEIRSENRQGELPPFSAVKRASRKIGIDQNILDVSITDNALWLKGLIWPDLLDRFARIESAIEQYRATENITLVEGKTLADFESVITSVPQHEALFIYHTHVLYQFTVEERKAFRQMIQDIGAVRDLNYLAVEGGSVFDKPAYKMGEVVMELISFEQGVGETQVLGKVDAHGRWIEWGNH